MKQTIHFLLMASASAGLLLTTGCSKSGKTITTTPAPYVLTPQTDSTAHLNMTFHVPGHYFSKRSRLVITPQLVSEDTVVSTYTPVVLDAPVYNKKKIRREVLEGYTDPYAGQAVKIDNASRAFNLPYDKMIRIPSEIDNARVVAVVSTDGCGECTGIDTVDVATFSTPATLIDTKKELKLNWIEPEFKIRPKIMEGKGVARLQFVINKNDINLQMGNNRHELEDMVAKLAPILNDSLATLTSLRIFGMASADGPLSFNTPLSRNRANSARQWLIQRLGISPAVQKIITIGSKPEGWQPVLDAMLADHHPDAPKVKAILDRYANQNDDVAERYIRRLPCWKDIRAKYLQKDRKVEYVYTYRIRSFTKDTELLDMYKKRPDAFNEDELLRVASLAVDDRSRKEVYQTLMHYFPQSKVGANNLAVLYLREGNTKAAQETLDQQKEFTPEQLNTLAATYVYNGNYERAIELLKDVDLPAARYNLGLLKARQRKLSEAYDLLHGYGDVNSAIMALSVNRNEEARRIMASVKDTTPLAEYVRAMTEARLKDVQGLFTHLVPACKDEKLHRRAKTEPDFEAYKEDERFKALIK